MTTADPVTDWRGTPITPGALVVYGAPVGRSIAMVEAVVATPMLTPSGRIWLDVVRRSYGHIGAEVNRVHVGADRLTVIAALPPSGLQTANDIAAGVRERNAMWAAEKAAGAAVCAKEGHDWEPHPSWDRNHRCGRCWTWEAVS